VSHQLRYGGNCPIRR